MMKPQPYAINAQKSCIEGNTKVTAETAQPEIAARFLVPLVTLGFGQLLAAVGETADVISIASLGAQVNDSAALISDTTSVGSNLLEFPHIATNTAQAGADGAGTLGKIAAGLTIAGTAAWAANKVGGGATVSASALDEATSSKAAPLRMDDATPDISFSIGGKPVKVTHSGHAVPAVLTYPDGTRHETPVDKPLAIYIGDDGEVYGLTRLNLPLGVDAGKVQIELFPATQPTAPDGRDWLQEKAGLQAMLKSLRAKNVTFANLAEDDKGNAVATVMH